MGLGKPLADALAGEEGRQRDADRVHVEVPLAVVSLDAGGLQVGEESRAARYRGKDRIARLGLPAGVLHPHEAFGELWMQREHIVPFRLGRVPPQTEDRRIGVEHKIRPPERFRFRLPQPGPEESEVERRPLEPDGTQLRRPSLGDFRAELAFAGTAIEPLGGEQGPLGHDEHDVPEAVPVKPAHGVQERRELLAAAGLQLLGEMCEGGLAEIASPFGVGWGRG